MMNKLQLFRARRFIFSLAVLVIGALLHSFPVNAQVALPDQPLTLPTVPKNMLLSLSVEYPTAIAVAYPYTGSLPYTNSSASPYLGYFDPGKCYSYVTSASDPNAPYFTPYAITTNQTCVSTVAHPLWSGNWLNWASMQTIDVFRWALTGGYRSVDTASISILEKGWSPRQGSYGDTPDKSVSVASDISGATPFTFTNLSSSIWGLGNVMYVTATPVTTTTTSSSTTFPYVTTAITTNTNNLDGTTNVTTTTTTGGSSSSSTTTSSFTPVTTPYTNQSSAAGTASSTAVYALKIRVLVCNALVGVESNCTAYGSNYKPEGLLQEYAMNIRFAAMGYLNDPSDYRDGGVLRASMKFVGPQQPSGSSNVTNHLAEWSSSTGVFVTNPSPNDIALSTTSPSPAVTSSGVINYLNQFGEYSHSYKSNDPVSELYYAGIRYFENLNSTGAPSGVGNPSPAPIPYVSGTSAPYTSTSGNVTAAMADGFPVITTWADPILYACQPNFILGIGDVNTHSDADIPGRFLTDSSDVSAIPPDNILGAVSYGGQTGVTAATNMVGQLEGLGNLGQNWWQSGDHATYYMAGLAYFAHTTDLRPNDFQTPDNLNGSGGKKYIQTANTYWLDVQEYQEYDVNNQFYLSTKYGSFTIPVGFLPFSSYNTNTAGVPQLAVSSSGALVSLSNGAWTTNGGTQGGTPCTSISSYNGNSALCNLQPDNYFSALDARKMVAGLQSAFSKANTNTAYGTAFSAISANPTISGSVSYSSNYVAGAWSGDVIATTPKFNTTAGAVSESSLWDAAALLTSESTTTNPAGAANSRIIITCCTSSPAAGLWGLPFEATSFTNTTFSRTNYQSFLNVPNVPAASQSIAKFTNYLRGDRTNEICIASSSTTCSSSSGVYRSRASLLGDIVDSLVVAVGPPSAPYAESTNLGYASFSMTYASRNPTVYVGANDGMLHAFNGISTGGNELFAYVPSFVYGCSSPCTPTPSVANPVISGANGLASLGNPAFVHHYLVDATPVIKDIDLQNTGGSISPTPGSAGYTPQWASVLVGGLGKGGQGYYALNVTNVNYSGSTSNNLWDNETHAIQNVLWEFTDSRMGDSYGKPVIVKTSQYGWVVIFTSGYNNADGNGYFFIVNAATGALIQAIPTNALNASATNQSGLAHATAFIPNSFDYTADSVYAGDLFGNLWRLDLTPKTGAYAAPTLIAQLTDPSGNAQPVTTDPYPVQQPNTLTRYVMVGTGSLLTVSDETSTQIQSFYAVLDGQTSSGGFYTSGTLPAGISFPITRAKMVANTNLLVGITPTASQPMGWYYDLSTSVTTGVAQRINIDPDTFYGDVTFAANLPGGTVCSPGGSNTIYATNFATGSSILVSPSNSSTFISSSSAISGLITQIQFDSVGGVGGTTSVYAGNNQGQVQGLPSKPSGTTQFQRINWREVPTAD